MKINWVLADAAEINPAIDIDSLKNVGPFWGGWRTWRSYQTDNVICHNESEARNLITKNFHNRCNLYLSDEVYPKVGNPTGVKLYRGEFNQLIDHPDEIISMHLAAATSDIILLVGFDLSSKDTDVDRLSKHKWHNYVQYFLQIMKSSPDVQWVLLDQKQDLLKELKKVSNCQFDTLENVLTQFS